MPRTYSERLIHAKLTDLWYIYNCPAGSRAILRNVLFQTAAAGGAYWIDINGTTALYTALPGANTNQTFETRIVIYGGEYLRIFVTGLNCAAIASGYVFGGGPALELLPAPDEIQKPQPPPPQPYPWVPVAA